MNLAQATAALFGAFESQWPALSGGVAFCEEDESFEKPATFARISIVSLASSSGTLGAKGAGNAKQIRNGILKVQIFVPVDGGAVAKRTLAQHVITIFERGRFGTGGEVVCMETTPTELDTEGQYAGVVMSTRFWFYETV